MDYTLTGSTGKLLLVNVSVVKVIREKKCHSRLPNKIFILRMKQCWKRNYPLECVINAWKTPVQSGLLIEPKINKENKY